MTAEIAIMNAMGVALATDSAVTLNIQTPNFGKNKIYNSSDKLFSLSKFHPVGIMIFGNAQFVGIPWEIIVKKFRKQLWDKEYNNLRDYVNEFIQYVSFIIPETRQQEYLLSKIHSFLAYILSEIKKDIRNFTDSNQQVELKDIRRIINQVISDQHRSILGMDNIPNYSLELSQKINKLINAEIDSIISSVFENLPLSTKVRKQIIEIAESIFIKTRFPNTYSGIVIAGYGKEEDFPSLIELKVDGAFDNVLKYIEEQNPSITFENTATIVPFAQQEMVCTFMEGIDPEYQNIVDGVISKLLDEYPNKLLERFPNLSEIEKKKVLKELSKISIEMKDDIIDQLNSFRLNNFINPVISIVSALPKDELAVMAETLVNLTSFKRKMSLDAETVGGPIDVAVISKGDGFVWIKRKMYFDEEINHHFIKNYFQN